MSHPLTLEQVMLLEMIKNNAPAIKKTMMYLLTTALKAENKAELPCCPMMLFAVYCIIDDM